MISEVLPTSSHSFSCSSREVSIIYPLGQKWKLRLRSTFSERDWPAMTLKQNQTVPFCVLLNTTNKMLEVMGKLQRKDSLLLRSSRDARGIEEQRERERDED